MQKACLFVSSFLLCLTLAGCGQSAPLPVQSLTWDMTSVQSGADGSVTAVGAERQEIYPDAVVMDMTCRFTESAFTLHREDLGESWTGTYRVSGAAAGQTVQYTLDFQNNKQGRAVRSLTEYADGSKSHTLILSIEEHTLNFTAGPAS